MYCRNCGKQLLPGENICSNCGTAVRKEIPQINPADLYNRARNSYNTVVNSFAAKDAKFWISLFKVINFLYVIACTVLPAVLVYYICDVFGVKGDDLMVVVTCTVIFDLLIALIGVCKNMLFVNIVENVNIVAKNSSENNKR